MSVYRDAALSAKAWPFQEARELLKRIGKKTPKKGYVLFETGYGPSGLPHIGTFGEVARTSMVRHAFMQLSDIPTRLFAFSDDMDGLRKVPDNVPNKEMLTEHLGKSLSNIPDPYGTHDSFGAHNNARLQAFLDDFGFEYEFKSSTEIYKSGDFDKTLLEVLQNYEAVINITLPTLGEERRATYSPFLPVCKKTGQVLQVAIKERKVEAGTIVYENVDGSLVEAPVTGGHCKMQWKADWAMRWKALGVDYEMSGKDLIDSVKQSSAICRAIGGKPPVGFTYELFLDDNGEKISKSRGNGLSVEEWLSYASPESLSLFMYQKPKTAKRLFFDVIPRNIDDYLSHLNGYGDLEDAKKIENPVWHIHSGTPPEPEIKVSYNILLNLASVCNSEDKSVLWHFISRYRPEATPETAPILDRLVGYAINYYRDFVKPNKQFRKPDELEAKAMEALLTALDTLPAEASAKDIQSQVYAIGKELPFDDLKTWFKALYEILLGQSQGPRMGSFIALYGIEETKMLISRALKGEDLS
ncbi:MAG: lysine--tRNA ligase [Rhodospirillales bacterium]|nr:lysine--tRNA ligase [Rhodospirillales bacterium]